MNRDCDAVSLHSGAIQYHALLSRSADRREKSRTEEIRKDRRKIETRGKRKNRGIKEHEHRMKQDNQCTYNVTVESVRAHTVVMEKQ
jgi:hypothetical protein